MLVPIRLPGYYEQSPNVFVSCVPDSACPAIDTSALEAAALTGILGLTPYFAALQTEVGTLSVRRSVLEGVCGPLRFGWRRIPEPSRQPLVLAFNLDCILIRHCT